MNKDLEGKIFDYLEKLEKREVEIQNNKKKNLLLASKREYEEIEKTQKDYQELFSEISKEEQDYLSSEIKNLVEQKEQIIAKIKEQIVSEEGIKQNVIMELRPGTGGTEAGLFTRDLYRMYTKFVESKN
jgi:peptide chain release factor 1